MALQASLPYVVLHDALDIEIRLNAMDEVRRNGVVLCMVAAEIYHPEAWSMEPNHLPDELPGGRHRPDAAGHAHEAPGHNVGPGKTTLPTMTIADHERRRRPWHQKWQARSSSRRREHEVIQGHVTHLFNDRQLLVSDRQV